MINNIITFISKFVGSGIFAFFLLFLSTFFLTSCEKEYLVIAFDGLVISENKHLTNAEIFCIIQTHESEYNNLVVFGINQGDKTLASITIPYKELDEIQTGIMSIHPMSGEKIEYKIEQKESSNEEVTITKLSIIGPTKDSVMLSFTNPDGKKVNAVISLKNFSSI